LSHVSPVIGEILNANAMLPTNKIICGNNVDVLATFPDGCIDLTVTSPPYDNLRTYKGFNFDFEGVAQQLYRVTKTGGVVVWVIGDATINGSETCTSFKQALQFVGLGFNLHDTMIYQKFGCQFPEVNRYYQQFEYMFVLSKGKPRTTNLIRKENKLAGKRFNSAGNRQANGVINPMSFHNTGREPVIKEFGVMWNVWRISAQRQAGHPAPFPEKLAHDHIISWSNEGDIVLDPFSGSGTTAKMAKETKRKFIGIDCSEEYCEIARKRLSYDTDIAVQAAQLSPDDFNDIII